MDEISQAPPGQSRTHTRPESVVLIMPEVDFIKAGKAHGDRNEDTEGVVRQTSLLLGLRSRFFSVVLVQHPRNKAVRFLRSLSSIRNDGSHEQVDTSLCSSP